MTAPDRPDPQDWWHSDPPEPFAGLGLACLALWLLALIPLNRLWRWMNGE